MADWLDTADKVASIVGAAAGVMALVITMRSNSRRDVPARDAAAPRSPVAQPPSAEPAPIGEPSPFGDREPVAEPRLISPPDPAAGWGEPGSPSPPGGWRPAGPSTAGSPPVDALPSRSPCSSAGSALGLLAFFAGTALLGAWLLSWLLSWLGGGSVGPWWLLAGMVVSYGLGLFFWFTELDGPGVVGLYVVWVPAAAWLLARTVVYHWFPEHFGNQGALFVVVFVVVLLAGAAIGLRKAFRSR